MVRHAQKKEQAQQLIQEVLKEDPKDPEAIAKYQATAKFVKKGKVDEAAREAKRALDSKEAAELEAAEAKGRAGDPKMWEKNPSRPK